MARLLDVVLLLALPAAGKSEIRRFLQHLDPERRADEFHMGDLIHLDDYPYVRVMRLISRTLTAAGADPVFFADTDRPFIDGREWGVLVHLLNEDFAALHGASPAPRRGGMLERFDRARRAMGAPAPFAAMDAALRTALEETIEPLVPDLPVPASGPGAGTDRRTVLIEFARGGPEEAPLPLPPYHGYGFSLGMLAPRVLSRAVLLYVWVTPEESRRRNRERAGEPGAGGESILHHSVPEEVMRREYGCDDLAWLLDTSDRAGTVTVQGPAGRFHLPAVVFDNRVDRTSFLRNPPASWPPEDVAALHADLAAAFGTLAAGTAA